MTEAIFKQLDKDFAQRFGETQDTNNNQASQQRFETNLASLAINATPRYYSDQDIADFQSRLDALGINMQVPRFPAEKVAMPKLPDAICFTDGRYVGRDYRPMPKLQHIDLLNPTDCCVFEFSYDKPSDQYRCQMDDDWYKLELLTKERILFLTDLDDFNENIDVEYTIFHTQVTYEPSLQALADFKDDGQGDFVLIVPNDHEERGVFWLPQTVFHQYCTALKYQRDYCAVANQLLHLEGTISQAERAVATKVQFERFKVLGIAYKTAFKPSSSGLLRGNWGDAAYIDSATHFVFDESHGKHEKGDFLCSNPKGDCQPSFVSYDVAIDGVVVAEIPKLITCESCLKKLEAMLAKANT